MQINNAFVLREIYGQYLLIPTHSNEAGDEIISLNEVGAYIWKLASNGLPKEEIVNQLNRSYCLEKGSVEESAIISFIEALCERSLLYEQEA